MKTPKERFLNIFGPAQKAPTPEAPTREYPSVSQLNPEFAARNTRLLTAYDGCMDQAVTQRQAMTLSLPRSMYPQITDEMLLAKAREYETRLVEVFGLKPDSTLKDSHRLEIASHDVLLILLHQPAIAPITLATAYHDLGQNIEMDTIRTAIQAVHTYFESGFKPIK